MCFKNVCHLFLCFFLGFHFYPGKMRFEVEWNNNVFVLGLYLVLVITSIIMRVNGILLRVIREKMSCSLTRQVI